MFSPTFWSLVGGALHVLVVVSAFFVVPVNRKPSSATAWLLLITIAPLIGVLIFLLIGNPKLPLRRRQLQHQMSALIVQAIDQAGDDPAAATLLAPPTPPVALPHAALAQHLGGMPPFAGNCVELLPDYDAIIDRMAQEIDEAKRFVHVEFYIIALDRTTEGFFAAMERAVKRGVKVRLLLDQIGSRKFPRRKEMEQHLTASGVDWHYMLPVGKPGEWLRLDLRNHRKILVVDGEVAYTGSLNLIDRTYHRKDDLYYDELCVRVTGPVAAQFEAVFVTDWYAETDELLDRQRYPELREDGWRAAGESLCQLRGVKVTLINSEAVDQLFVASAQRSYYEQLLRAGIEVLQYKHPILLHSKTITVDDQIAMIGSSNMDIRSFTLNMEVSLVIYDPAVVAELHQVFDGYIARAKRVELNAWKNRPAGQRLIENIARLTAALQ